MEKSVAALVVNSKGLYLLLHPSRGTMEWALPGGHQEKGESDMETLKREIAEECGIHNFEIVDGFVEENSYINSKGNNRVILVYLVKVGDPKIILSREHSGFAWFAYKDAMDRLNHEKWKRILKKADMHLSGKNA